MSLLPLLLSAALSLALSARVLRDRRDARRLDARLRSLRE